MLGCLSANLFHTLLGPPMNVECYMDYEEEEEEEGYEEFVKLTFTHTVHQIASNF